MTNIVLIGFMGAGKTAVAKKLAHALGQKLVSIDEQIVEQEGRSINEIFSTQGEKYFRSIEKQIVSQISHGDGLVIDCGGGTVLDAENMAHLKRNGTVIYLKASAKTIFHRTKNAHHRPLLNVQDPQAKIEELLSLRGPFYQQADLVINTDEKTEKDVVQEILKALEKNS